MSIRSRLVRSAVVGALLALLAIGLVSGSGAQASIGPPRGPAQPVSCQCGGPGGAPDLSHISPWTNRDCAVSIGLSNTTSVDVYWLVHGSLVVRYAGWAEWRYSSNGSCHGYQWIRFHLNMAVVEASTVAAGFATMMWLTQDPLDWTTY